MNGATHSMTDYWRLSLQLLHNALGGNTGSVANGDGKSGGCDTGGS